MKHVFPFKAASKLPHFGPPSGRPRLGDDLHTFPRPYKTSTDNRKQFNAGIVEFVGEESCLTPHEYGRKRKAEQYYEVKLK